MARFITVITFITLFFCTLTCAENPPERTEMGGDQDAEYSVLVFTKTEGWRHKSIEPGVEAVQQLGSENGFGVTWSEDSGQFTEENLTGYDAVIFLNTTLDILDDTQQEAFESYIQNGGGFVGIHAAADTEYDWQWYGDLVGAYFDSHPSDPNVREAVVELVDENHIATEHLPEQWERPDEWYNFGYINESTNVLLELDTDSYEGSSHPGNHPISWYHEYDGGRAFYTGLGHTSESFSEPLYLDHLLGGIKYAMGIN